MTEFVKYIFNEIKNKRLQRDEAIRLLQEYERGQSVEDQGVINVLLHENSSNGNEIAYISMFDGSESFFEDHKVKGNKMLPGTVCLQIAKLAVEDLLGINDETIKDDVFSISDVVWLRPIVHRDNQKFSVKTELKIVDDEIRFSLCDENNENHIYCHGCITNQDSSPAFDNDINAQEFIKESLGKVPGATCYGIFLDKGLSYGQTFRGIETLYYKDLSSLTYFSFSIDEQSEILPASVLDCALQATIGLSIDNNKEKYGHAETDVNNENALEGESLRIPYSLGHLNIYKSLPKQGYIHATYSKKMLAGIEKDNVKSELSRKNNVSYDIDVINNDGEIVASIQEFTALSPQDEKEVHTENNPSVDNEENPFKLNTSEYDDILLAQPKWKKESVYDVPEGELLSNIFSGGDNLQGASTVITIDASDKWNSAIRSHYSASEVISLSLDDSNLINDIEQNFLTLFNIIKELLENKTLTSLPILILCALDSDERHFLSAMTLALLRTAVQENPKILAKVVSFSDSLSSESVLSLLDKECIDRNQQIQEVRYLSNEVRQIRIFEEFLPSLAPFGTSETAIKPEGVYWITGGLGGLGQVFIQYIASYKNTKIYITGRSALDKDKQKIINSYTRKGIQLEYCQADVSNKDDVKSVFDSIQEKYGKLNGIIHSAGMLLDAYILKKTEQEISQVFTPKVSGIVYLDEVTKDTPIDFIVGFSSLSGIAGNPGQADYSAANAFMDVYLNRRDVLKGEGKRFGVSLSINWPLWRAGGMQIDETSERLLKEKAGLIPLEEKAGCDAFNLSLLCAMTTNITQSLVASGEVERLKEVLNVVNSSSKESDHVKTMDIFNQENDKQLEELKADNNFSNALEKDLKEHVAKLLKMDVSDIDLDTDMSEYGFDSVTFTGLASAISKAYDINIMPTVFFEHPNLESLIAYLGEDYEQALINKYASSVEYDNSKKEVYSQDKPEGNDKGTKKSSLANRIAMKMQANANRTAPLSTPKSKSKSINETIVNTDAQSESIEFTKQTKEDAVAIVGVSGIFPGSPDVESFWKNLEENKDLITEVPDSRWDWKEYEEQGLGHIKWGGFIDSVAEFDPLFFNLSPHEAELMDPQQRLFMQTVWHALEDSGHKIKDISGTNTALYVGVANTDYREIMQDNGINFDGKTATGSAHSMLANRLSYLFNIHGPSEPIDTACSSSLVAIHRAVEKIKSGECTLAIAGGVNVILTPTLSLSFARAGMLSKDGRCKTFDNSANGYVRGEGVGAIVLKPLHKALADKNPIYGLVRGSAENHGGRASALTAPNPKAQQALLVSAYRQSGLEPESIGYIEAHGTGTELGDPIEINGLKAAFKELNDDYHSSQSHQRKTAHCAIGSVKTNIGHLETAAGIAGVLKVIMAIKHKKLPGNRHLEEQNQYIDLKGSPFYFVKNTQDWEPPIYLNGKTFPRRAGVSSFGFGGSNAHVIIEEYNSEQKANLQTSHVNSHKEGVLIILSARDEERLKAYVKTLIGKVGEQLRSNAISLQDLAYTLQVGRDPMDVRAAWFVKNKDELLTVWQEYLSGKAASFFGERQADNSAITLFTGDDELKEAMQKWIAKGKLHKLAELWVRGIEIDWTQLYLSINSSTNSNSKEKVLPQRLSLPGYPFAKEHYWLSENSTSNLSKHNSASSNRKNNNLHPLIHENRSDLDEQRFFSVFNGSESFLADHLVAGDKILPGVAQLMMAHTAVALSSRNSLLLIKDIVLSHALRVKEPVNVKTALYPDDNSTLHYEISHSLENGGDILLSQGTVILEEINSFSEGEDFVDAGNSIKDLTLAPSIDLEKIQARCTQSCHGEDCYQQLAEQGLNYGASFKGIKSLSFSRYSKSTNDGEALAEIVLPTHDGDNNFPPGALDSALHSLLGLRLGLTMADSSINHVPEVPFRIGEVYFYSSLPEKFYAYARFSNTKTQVNTRNYHIDLVDEQGLVLVRIVDFSALPMLSSQGAISNIENRSIDKKENVDEVGVTLKEVVVNEGNDDKTDDSYILLQAAQEYFKALFSTALKLSPERIDSKALLEKYGIDSIMILSLTETLEKSFGDLPKTLFFEYQTLEAIAGYFISDHKATLEKLLDLNFEKYDSEKSGSKKYDSEKDKAPIEKEKAPSVSYKSSSYNKPRRFRWDNSSEKQEDTVAIIGVSGRYPQAANLNEYWENLKAGRNCIEEIPAERWNYKDFNELPVGARWGGFVPDVDKFDPFFFNISPREAEVMDPQERLFLEIVWETLEDAGYTRESLYALDSDTNIADDPTELGGNVGVYVGVMYEEYQLYGAEQSLKGDPTALSGNPASIANRISYFCNFHGPSMAIDTMCSSSLTAIHLACESLRNKQCTVAIAGGVNVSVHPNKYRALGQGNFLSSTGRCQTFGEGGDGYVPGEGVGAVLLKPLSLAKKDGDQIYGVIRGTSLNHGGKTNGYTVPNPRAQANVIKRSFQRAGVNPRHMSYLEAHGTGTSLGDPIEIRGLSQAFSSLSNSSDERYQYCAIGSAKSNIGHCESAAGIAGVSKVLLQLKHRTLVPSLHSEVLNPNISFDTTPFKVQHECSEWERPLIAGQQHPRLAGISSFGAGGSNAHVIIEEYPIDDRRVIPLTHGPQLLPLSARKQTQLVAYAERLYQYLSGDINNGEVIGSLADIAYTLQTGREHFDHRVVFLVSDKNELREALHKFSQGQQDEEHILVSTLKNTLPDNTNVFQSDDVRTMAEQWLEGRIIDWTVLQSPIKPRRLSLPTYPFAKKRYWFDSFKKGEKTEVKSPSPVKKQHIPSEESLPFNTTKISVKHVEPSFWQTSDFSEAHAFDEKTEGDVVKLNIIDGNIAHIMMHNVSAKNMFSKPLVLGLQKKFLEILANEDIKAVVLSGYDNIFCMGGTKDSLLDIADQQAKFTDVPFLYRGLLELDIPVVSAIQGHAFGGGLLFGLYGDIVLMSEEGVYTANFMEYGFTPGMGATFILKERLGGNLATEMMYTAKTFTGKEIQSRNAQVLVRPGHEVVNHALAIAKQLAQKPRRALSVLKKELSGKILSELLETIESELEMHDRTFNGDVVKNSIHERFTKRDLGGQSSHKKEDPINSLNSLVLKNKTVNPKGIKNSEKTKVSKKITLEALNPVPILSNDNGNKESSLKISKDKVSKESSIAEGVTRKNVTDNQAISDSITENSSVGVSANLGEVADSIKGIICKSLHLDADEIDYDMSFQDVGIDSISGVEIVRDINRRLNVEIEASDLYEHYTISKLTDYIGENFLQAVGELAAGKPEVSREDKQIKETIDALISTPIINSSEVKDGGKISEELHQQIQGEKEQVIDIRTEQKEIKQGEAKKEGVKQELRNIIKQSLHLEDDEIDDELSFQDLGVDSITGVEIVRDVNKALGLALETSVLYDYSTISALSEHISVQDGVNITPYIEPSIEKNTHDTSSASSQSNGEQPVKKPLITPSSNTTKRSDDTNSVLAKSSDQSEKTINTEVESTQRESTQRESIQKDSTQQEKAQQDIAIIGMSGRFSGADNVNEFWHNLVEGVDTIHPMDDDRLAMFNEQKENNARLGGFLKNIDAFDAKFFNISPNEAKAMDPQQRLFLQEAWKTIEDAGYAPSSFSEKEVGVFVGVAQSDYASHDASIQSSPFAISGNTCSMLVSRIAYILNLSGPCVAIDTACSSSLSALHLACEGLRNGDCQEALVGGTHVLSSNHLANVVELLGIISSTGKSKTFDQNADGWVMGEGVGALLLKPLKQAEKDNDSIYGVIKASGYNQNGQSNGLGSPKASTQTHLHKKVYSKANINPETIDYIEVQGVSDALGDQIEVRALKDSFSAYTNKNNFCALGSLKPNIGHPITASGIACIIKVLQAFKYQKIPASIHCDQINDKFALDKSAFYVNRQSIPWDAHADRPRRAAINGFGFSGTNAHIVLDEYPDLKEIKEKGDDITAPSLDEQAFIFSAKNEQSLVRILENFYRYLCENKHSSHEFFNDLAYTLQVGRNSMTVKFAIVAKDMATLTNSLSEILKIINDEPEKEKQENLPEHLYFTYNRKFSLLKNIYDSCDVKTVKDSKGTNTTYELVNRWVNNEKVDWYGLYSNKNYPKRLHIPTYSFDATRFWCSIPSDNKPSMDESVSVSNGQRLNTLETSELNKSTVCRVIASLLGVEENDIDSTSPLEDYGFDSILFMQFVKQIQHSTGALFDLNAMRDCRSIDDIFTVLASQNILRNVERDKHDWSAYIKGLSTEFPELIAMNTHVEGRPVFWLHSGLGGVETYYSIASVSERPFFAIQAKGWMSEEEPLQGIAAMADYYVRIIETIQPEGPYDLGGYSLGGILAYEVTRRLQRNQQVVNSIVMVDAMDSIIFKNVNISYRTEMLHTINILLLPLCHENIDESVDENESDTKINAYLMERILIKKEDINHDVDDEAFLQQLIELAKSRGLKQDENKVKSIIVKNSRVQQSFKDKEYSVESLPNPNDVFCHYFRNQKGFFLGDLSPYFSLEGDVFDLDKKTYWTAWEENIRNINIYDVDTPNHMTILSEGEALEEIKRFCQSLYKNKNANSLESEKTIESQAIDVI